MQTAKSHGRKHGKRVPENNADVFQNPVEVCIALVKSKEESVLCAVDRLGLFDLARQTATVGISS
jgi:hypothetical protein